MSSIAGYDKSPLYNPTRNSNILDLVLTTNSDLVKSTIICEGMSDHDLVVTKLDIKIKPPKKKQRKIFLFKRPDAERLRDNISNNLEVLPHIDDLWINSSLYRLCLAFRRALY